MDKPASIGWATTKVACAMRQGASGTLRVRLTVSDDDGQPLPSYAGFTAIVRFVRPPGRAFALMLAPNVTGDAEAQSLTVDVAFATADTATLAPGALAGDLCILSPDGERQFPVEFALELQRALAPPPGVEP